ncbi:2'-5' RNA ligase family protein [Streptomyces sp. JL4002]|uniref:2'-5' RNA ligase family protein n=1 Tax=Streptomyces TaxID=1883 RepID=UPI003B28A390
MHSVELLPDADTDRAVRDVWRQLADRGLPSQAHHRHPTNRPHLTLATADHLPPDTRAEVLCVLAEALPVPLRLDGVVRWSGRVRVLAWTVRPEPPLLRLHEAVWRILRDTPGTGALPPLLAPARWVPHITLGRGAAARWAAADEESAALTAGTAFAAVTGEWTSARRYDSVTRTVTSLVP